MTVINPDNIMQVFLNNNVTQLKLTGGNVRTNLNVILADLKINKNYYYRLNIIHISNSIIENHNDELNNVALKMCLNRLHMLEKRINFH